MLKVVLFTGAGFSKPLDLPTTQEFIELIDKSVVNHDGFFLPSLKAFLGNEFYDIEVLLSTMELFIQKDNSYIKYLLLKYPMPNAPTNSKFTEVRNLISQYQYFASSTVKTLKSALFDVLTKYNKEKAVIQYANIISEIKNINKEVSLSITTTNYDLIFEDAQEDLEKIYTDYNIEGIHNGFSQKSRRYYWQKDLKWDWELNTIEYKKIHGSLDWHFMEDGRIMSTELSLQPENPDNMLLLYPGFKGTPKSEPFQTLHDDFFHRILTCDYILVIGFAFRDEYITNQFITALKVNDKCRLFCFNPTPIEKLPRTSAIKKLVGKFPNRFIYIPSGIDPDNLPIINLEDLINKNP